MPYSHRSRRSHKEGRCVNQAEERVWMEALEGRVLLAQGNILDLSNVVVRKGHGEAEYQFEAEAGRTYLFIETLNSGGIHLSDEDGARVDDAVDGASRILWQAKQSGTYILWFDGGYDPNQPYELVMGPKQDDFGNTNRNATELEADQPIHGKIEDYDDRDV